MASITKQPTCLLAVAALACCAACDEVREVGWGNVPTSLAVRIVEGETGGATGAPLPLPEDGLRFVVDVDLLAGAGDEVVPVDGWVELSARPGRVVVDGAVELEDGTMAVPLVGGRAQGVSLTVKGAFGETRIWARDVATGVRGVSDAIHLRNPTVVELQGTEVCSPMEKEFVVVDSGDLVVTHVTTNGMTITDVSTLDEKGRPTPYSSVFVFSFSRPMSQPNCTEDEEADTLLCSYSALVPVEVCDRVRNVAGGVNAFNGYTELTFPSWDLEEWDPKAGKPCEVPEPFDLTELSCEELGGKNLLRYEGALVRVRDVEVDCKKGAECYEDSKYVKYGEWYVDLKNGACKTARMFVVSNLADPHFDPFLPENARISSITGTLKTLYFAPKSGGSVEEQDVAQDCAPGGDFTWIIEPRCPDDIVVSGEPRPIRESCLPR